MQSRPNYLTNSQLVMKNDAINDKILRELTRDGRMPNLELAERVGLSPSACLRRVQELERSGVITGYRAVIDRSKLGVGFVAYMAVGLSEHTKAAQQAFERAVDRHGGIPAQGRSDRPCRLQGVPYRRPRNPAAARLDHNLCRDGLAQGRPRLRFAAKKKQRAGNRPDTLKSAGNPASQAHYLRNRAKGRATKRH